MTCKEFEKLTAAEKAKYFNEYKKRLTAGTVSR